MWNYKGAWCRNNLKAKVKQARLRTCLNLSTKTKTAEKQGWLATDCMLRYFLNKMNTISAAFKQVKKGNRSLNKTKIEGASGKFIWVSSSSLRLGY